MISWSVLRGFHYNDVGCAHVDKHCASYELEPAAQCQMKSVDVMLLMLLLLMMLFLLQLWLLLLLLLLARYEQSPLAQRPIKLLLFLFFLLLLLVVVLVGWWCRWPWRLVVITGASWLVVMLGCVVSVCVGGWVQAGGWVVGLV